MSQRNKFIYKRYSLIIYLLLLCFLTSICIINLYGYTYFSDTDIYGESYLAKLMWEQKTLFPKDWVFGNQYYIIATPNLSALLYGITGSMNLSMGLASCIMTVFIILTLYWFLLAFCSVKECITGILLFLCSNINYNIAENPNGQIFFVMASYYSSYIITFFVVTGYFARIIYHKNKPQSKLMLLLSIILSFATGMQSLRQMAIMVLPLLCVTFLYLLYNKIIMHVDFQRNSNLLWYPLIIFLANLSGYILIQSMNIPTHTIYGSLSVNLLCGVKDKLFHIFRGLASIAGYPAATYFSNPSFKDWYYIPCCILMVTVILLVFLSIIRIVKNKAFLSVTFLYVLICMVSLFGIGLSNLILDISIRSIYFFPYLILSTVAVLYLIQTSNPQKKNVIQMCICFYAIAVFIISYLPSIKISFSNSSYKHEIIEFMQHNNYSIIYSNWYYAGTIVSISDGAISGGMWSEGELEDNIFVIREETNPRTIYSELENQHAIYIFTQDMVPIAIKKANDLGAKLIYLTSIDANNTSLQLYKSTKQIMHFK